MKKTLLALAVFGLMAATVLAQPANNNFANRISLTGASASTTGSNSGATTEFGENTNPSGGARLGATVWWTWTAPATANVTIDTVGSSFDTVLAIYTGSSYQLTLVIANNNIATGQNQSRVTFNAQQGTTYQIQVGGVRSGFNNFAQGNITLNLLMETPVNLSSPANGSIFALGSAIILTASGQPQTPPIARMEFFRNGVQVGSVTTSPYTLQVTDSPLGTNRFYVVMVDSVNARATSLVATVTVVNPGVTITAPADGASYATNVINITAVGVLASGTVTNMTFYANGSLIGQDATAPFALTWNQATPGVHQLRAVGAGSDGLSYTSPPVFVAVASSLVATGSVWKYLDTGVDQGTAWVAPGFDDSGWASGPAELGNGDASEGRPEATVINIGPEGARYPTIYFRHYFTVANPAAYTGLILQVLRDDGAVIYLNGVEVNRQNMPAGTITYNSLAPASASDDGTTYYEANIANSLIAGTNVLAVEVHQNSLTSSDLSFDFALLGLPLIIRNQSPEITWVNPTNKAALSAPASVTLSVNAVDADGTVAAVEFFVDGASLGSDATSPFELAWNAPAIGFHTVQAVATDNEGATTASAINVTIHNASSTPLVQILSPTNGTVISGLEAPTNLPISAIAGGVGGVAGIEFRTGTTSIGSDSTEPYTITWNNAAFGSSALTAVVTDGQGRQATSALVVVTIIEPPVNTNPPVVFATGPARGSVITNLAAIQVVFSEKVTGVNASDLLVNGVAASAVSGSGSNYTFTVSQPAYGTLAITWAASHGITDIGWPSSLAFDPQTPGNTWTYDLADRNPPYVAAKTPAAGATVTNLPQISVTFSKPVQGVDAADFLVNGNPAIGLSGSGANYTFAFGQPASGTVNISWAANHGITDLVSPPNAFSATFASNVWSYTLDARTILVPLNATYTYFKGRSEASDPYNAWRLPGFDDSTWLSGPAPFYYDVNSPPVYSGNTALTDMQNSYTCVFLRHRFVVNNAAGLTNMFVQFRCDDGFAAWINGVEVARYAIGTGEPSYTTLANNAATPLVTYTYELPNPQTFLVEGTNVLSIQQFNTSASSSDLLLESQFYTYLADNSLIPPSIQLVVPSAGSVFALTNVTVKFSEPVTGVNAADLLMNGTPAQSVSGGGTNDTYIFTFAQPAFGVVAMTWAANHGMADLDQPPKAFNATSAGSTWQYQLLNANAPYVAAQTPVASAQVSNLTQISVIFSKPVTGVNASDLRINSLPAASVSGSGANYTFNFAQPAYGSVAVAWVTNHGIRDLESPANNFESYRAGNSWNYTLVDLTPPTVVSVSPASGSQVTNLTQITVTFSEAVAGVDAADLVINGEPATAVSGSGASYTFTFAQPNATVINVTFAANNGIHDLAISPNAFDRTAHNATWSYVTPDTLAPSLIAIDPAPAITVTRLDQITVIFSEPVSGVDETDLLLNSRPARSVSGSGAGPYAFTFLQPSNGVVEVRWVANHGIYDSAVTPNAFAGGEWTYVLNPAATYAGKIIINEIMANPLGGKPADEWIELRNISAEPISLAGWRFSRGIGFSFPNVTIPAGGYLVAAADLGAFRAKHPAVLNSVGGWTGTLANGGETIELVTAQGETVNRVRYSTQGDWAQRERGRGANLVESITRSGTTATVTIFSHGYTANDHVIISGADQPEYNGRFVVGGVSASTFTITVSGAPATPATGNIICRQVLDNGQSGWSWFSAADGFGRSLELVNPALPNDAGQNWLTSTVANGTPGQPNSTASTNIAPLVQNVAHFPPVPRSTNQVTITARVQDEAANGIQAVLLYYRDHTGTSPAGFQNVLMRDDGNSGDGLAGDRLYGIRLPAQASGTIIEFYVHAQDTTGLTRTWPAPTWNTNNIYGQLANALYQVDNEAISTDRMASIRAVMTGTERAVFPASDTASDAESQITLIATDGNSTEIRYNSGVRIRGAGSRSRTYKNNRINIPSDNPWNGRSAINLNSQFVYAQYVGNVLAQKSGLPATDSFPVQYRVNGVNQAPITAPNNPSSQGAGYGTYLLLYPVNGDLAEELWPEDGDGNIYRASIFPHNANFSYLGTNPSSYVTSGYYKNSNRTENDWSDLMNLNYAFSQITNEEDYRAAIRTNLNVQLWMRYFAYGSMVNYGETSMFNGRGDDYALYRGIKDPRFMLIGHDFDTIFGQGDTVTYYPTLTNSSIWIMLNPPSPEPNVPLLRRFMTNAAFAPIFFAELKRLCDTTFHPGQLNPLFDQLLGGWGPDATRIQTMKNHAFNRRAAVLSQIPLTLTVNSSLSAQNGFLYTTTPGITLFGQANAIETRQVLVNGNTALWSPMDARWTNSFTLRPGYNRVLVQSLNSNNVEFASSTVEIFYDTTGASVSGTISADTTWLAANGPYNVTGTLTIASGATLTIQAGTTVYLGSGVNLVVANGGRLLAEGTPTARIRFTRPWGSSTTWGGLTVNGSANSPETRIINAHFEFNNSTAIHATDGTVFLDGLTFGNPAVQYVSLDRSSFVVQNCTFPATTASFEPTHGSGGIKAGGRGIFRRNFFGRIQGYNDALDFTGGNRPSQPILQVINNVFMGSDDDLLDLDGTDAWIEGNIFLNTRRRGSTPDSGSAISGGSDSGSTSEITVVGNLFYEMDHMLNAKQGNFYTVLNNTMVRQNGTGSLDPETAVVILADDGTTQGAGMYLAGNIIHTAEQLTRNVTTALVTYTNNIIYGLTGTAWTGPGGGNLNVDPLLKYIPTLAEATSFTNWAQAQVMWDWFSLRPGSPAVGKGPGGRDLGGVVGLGAQIAGVPVGTTPSRSVTLRVGFNITGNGVPAAGFPNGSGYTHYKWRLDGGVWSAETPIGTPIVLSGLPDGPHYVEVTGRNDAGYYQDDAVFGNDAVITRSATWTVDGNASPLLLNEILASNNGVVNHFGTTPDLIELYNASDLPIDLEGIRITDDPTSPDRFTFPEGAQIGARQYLVLYANDPDGTSGYHLGFNLAQNGEAVYLYDAIERGGRLLDSITFGLQMPNYSIGRLANGEWNLTQPTFGSANQATGTGDVFALRINEWLALAQTPFSADFVELYNLSAAPVALGGLYFSDELVSWRDHHQIPALSFIAGGGYQVFQADGDASLGADHLNFRLANTHGSIGLFAADLTPIDIQVYGIQNINLSQGRSPNGATNVVSFTQVTPGAPNPVVGAAQPYGGALVINEVLADNATQVIDGATPDWVEIYNGTAGTVDLSDMSLTDDSTQPRRFVFGAATQITPGGYLRVLCDGSRPATNDNTGFGLRATGGSVFLFDKVAAGGSLLNSITYGLQVADLSIGRIPSGGSNWVLCVPTMAAANVAVPTFGNVNAVRINEWMASPSNGDDWFELFNPNTQPVSLDGLYLTDSLLNPLKHKIAPLSFLGAGTNAWRTIMADNNLGAGADHVNFALSAGGEAIGLFTAAGAQIDAVEFGPQTSGLSEGRLPDGGAAIRAFPGTDTPGSANYTLMTNIVINEVLTHTDLPLEDAIEIRNLGSQSVDLSGWWLSDDPGSPQKYQIPGPAVIPAGGFKVIYENVFTNRDLAAVPFALGSKGDEVVLAAYANNQLTGYRAQVKFGAAANGVSFGRYVNSVGDAHFVAMSARTFGEDDPGNVAQFRLGTGLPNAAPLVGPIVISEIMYHPPDLGTNDNTRDEYIELQNTSTVPVALYDPLHPTNTWRLRDAVDFEFPLDTTIMPGDFLIVVSFDPVADTNSLAAFREQYHLTAAATVVGPYRGKLANNNDAIELERPDLPDTNEVPYILVERVRYTDTAPWPEAADGVGYSLQRVNPMTYGNDPANWVAGIPNPGPAAAPLDIDSDGLPNAWEVAFGLDPFSATDAQVDSDGDGLSNYQEYLAGTHPFNPLSTLKLQLTVPPVGSGNTNNYVGFEAAPDRAYRLEHTTSLGGQAWQILSDITAAPTNRSIVVPVSRTDKTHFYRLYVR